MSTTEEIWSIYHTNLLAFVRKRVDDKVDAEDLLQDIFVCIHSRLHTLKDQDKLESWLYQITRNAIIDYYRARRPMDVLPQWLEQPQVSNDDKNRQELSSCLAPMIQQLPRKYRHAVQLSEVEGKTQKEIARNEDISLSGAKSRVQRGRALLKAMLHDCCSLEVNERNQLVDYVKKDGNCKTC